MMTNMGFDHIHSPKIGSKSNTLKLNLYKIIIIIISNILFYFYYLQANFPHQNPTTPPLHTQHSTK